MQELVRYHFYLHFQILLSVIFAVAQCGPLHTLYSGLGPVHGYATHPVVHTAVHHVVTNPVTYTKQVS